MQFYVSTISDNPRDIFKNLPVFEEHGISGIHFDVMDGIFVPRLGLYPELLRSIRSSSNLPIEVHLMLTDPDKYIEIFVESGASRVLVHFESLQNPHKTIELINRFGVESCLVLNPGTEIRQIEDYIGEIAAVMLMAINPGIPKHPFISSTLGRLKDLKNLISVVNPGVRIGIDGGVTFDNVNDLYQNGADWLICGSGTIFKPDGDLIENLSRLQAIKLNQM